MQTNNTSSNNYINLLLAFAFGVLWALFWAVDQVLAYVLFGATIFFLALFLFNLATHYEQRGGTYSREAKHPSPLAGGYRSPNPPTRNISTQETEKTIKLSRTLLLFAALGVALFFLFSWLDDFDASDDSRGTSQAYEQAEEFYYQEEYDSAYFYYKQSLQTNTEMQEAALVGLGNTLYMQKQVDSGRWYYEKALAINPEYTQARYNIGWWYYDQQQYQQSIIELKILIEKDPAQVGAMQLVGDNFYNLNEYDSAIRWYEGAYTNGARSRWLCHVMAYIYDKNNELDKAIPLYKEAIQYDSTLVDLYIRLGELVPGAEGEVYRYKAAALKIEQGN